MSGKCKKNLQLRIRKSGKNTLSWGAGKCKVHLKLKAGKCKEHLKLRGRKVQGTI